MSASAKSNGPDNGNREDIPWFEDYEERGGAGGLGGLRNKDILSYIKDIERNCRLEVSDEDHAGAKRSSNCSVRFSGGAVKSSGKPRSRVASKERKKLAPSRARQIERSSSGRAMDACTYCRTSRKSRLRYDAATTCERNFRRGSNILAEAACRYPRSLRKRNFYKRRSASLPRFYGWYSRKSRGAQPADTETTSLEVIEDRSLHVSPDLRVDRSRITGRRSSARVRAFASPRGRELGDSARADIYSRFASDERVTERDPRERNNARTIGLNEESNVAGDSANRRPLADRVYLDRKSIDGLATRTYQTSPKNQEYQRRDITGFGYPARRFPLPTFRDPSSLGNRSPAKLIASTSRKRVPWQRNQTAFEMPISVPASSIDGSSGRQTRAWRYENSDRRQGDRREQGSAYYCKPCLAKRSGRLCKQVRSRDIKRRLGCGCEDEDETADCTECCRCPGNANVGPARLADYHRPRRDGAYRFIGTNRGIDYTARGREPREALSRSTRSRFDEAGISDIESSAEASPRDAAAGEAAISESEVRDDAPWNYHGDDIEAGSAKWRASSFADDSYRARRSRGVLGKYTESNDDTKSTPREGTVTSRRKVSRERIRDSEARTPEWRPASSPGDSSWLRRNIAGSACECEEVLHDEPAACLVGSCTCVKHDGNDESYDSGDSSREASICCCRCSSARLQDDPVRKLESFCERVKAVNKDASRRVRPTRTSGDEWDRSEGEGVRMARRRTAGRNGRSKGHRRGDANLERVLVYPPRGAAGPPLTLYKRSSNIHCQVKGDAVAGFRYDVTYVQKFASPTWMPDLSPRVPLRETRGDCGCAG